jgi:hypothetical protein
MSNLTLAIDEELLRKARIAALEQHTSLNDLIRGYIETLTVGETVRRKTAVQELRLAFDTSTAKVGKRTWTRDELHERG